MGVVEKEAAAIVFLGGSWGATLGEDDSQWNARVRNDSSNQALAVKVRGNGETIRWLARVRSVEVAW